MPERSLLVGVPCYPPHVHISHYMSGLNTFAYMFKHDIPMSITAAADCALVGHARADLVSEFLARDFTHLLMIDADVGWQAEDVVRMMDHDVPLVGAVQVDKHAHQLQVSVADAAGDPEKLIAERYDRARGLIRADRVATCFMMIRRDCLERMIEAYPGHKVDAGRFGTPETADHWYGFFETPVVDGRWPGEDIRFCDLWRAIGGEVWVDPFVTLSHVVRKPMAGCLADSFKLTELEAAA